MCCRIFFILDWLAGPSKLRLVLLESGGILPDRLSMSVEGLMAELIASVHNIYFVLRFISLIELIPHAFDIESVKVVAQSIDISVGD